jgi:thiamine biosynthesis lipoprotein
MTAELERRLDLFGTRVRILVAPRDRRAAQEVERLFRRQHRLLTRFEPSSELSQLNADPRETVRVSAQLAGALEAALETARLTDGLVDPTLLEPLRRAGYATSRVGVEPADLRAALASAPARTPAEPHPRGAWRQVEVAGGYVRRPPGMCFDLGGSAKGYAADSAAALLAGHDSFAVDVGGDIAFGGEARLPRIVVVQHPFDHRQDLRFPLVEGAIATSGLASRVWEAPGGGYAHHLIDPSTGEPAWTGVIQATALAPTAVAAEALAKAALLAGPEAGRLLLAAHGGALVLDDGRVSVAGLRAGAARSAA